MIFCQCGYPPFLVFIDGSRSSRKHVGVRKTFAIVVPNGVTVVAAIVENAISIRDAPLRGLPLIFVFLFF